MFCTSYVFQIFCLVVIGIIFPKLKLLTILYAMKNSQFYIDGTQYHINRIPKILETLFLSFCQNHFFWHFGTTFGVSFLLGQKVNLEWFSFLSIFYNFVMYQIILLSMWKKDPIKGIILVTIIQYMDGIPPFYALIDNVSAVYFHPLLFIPEKLGFYFLCSAFGYFRNGS
jgi:hypothetical protein